MTESEETWKKFEELAEIIYRELSPHATVVRDDRIYGHESGINRQIDVSVRWHDGENDQLLIVDTKDYKTPVDVPKVGSFISLVRDVQASQGILVCSSGFTGAAKNYAKNTGVTLHNLHDAQSLKWCRELKIPILWVDLQPTVTFGMQCYYEAGDQISVEGNYIYTREDDGSYREVSFPNTFAHAWNSGVAARSVGAEHRIFSQQPIYGRVIDSDGVERWRLSEQACIIYWVERKSYLGDFEPSECRGLVDYIDDESFTATYLPIGEVPMVRDENWVEIEDPEKVAVQLRGTFVTTEAVQYLDPRGAVTDRISLSYLGPGDSEKRDAPQG